TGHAFTGEYYSTFSPPEIISCPCGEQIQTCKHILATCPAFKSKHDALCSVSEDLVVSDILGTEQGIQALSEFLKEMDAFKK
ncbi:hypothetical protein EDD16DRAFT_1446934, partial [Pisolithus croceorrhizus]